MLKQEEGNTPDAQKTSAESPSGANNIKENSMTPLDLLKINVNDKTEKKNGMTYLSWAWAWTEVLKADPKATWKVELWSDGTGIGQTVLMQIGQTAMVWVTTTIFGKSITSQLPVLDYKNKPVANPDAMAVNTAIMRCLVKSIAFHGLGLYIYAGDGVPEDDEVTPAAVVNDPFADAPVAVKMTVATKSAQAEVEVPVRPVTALPPDLDNPFTKDDGMADLFATGMIKYLDMTAEVKDLNGYWKSNQSQIDKLKASHPELYKTVRDAFAARKEELKPKAAE